MDHKITWIGFWSILSISLPTRESGIRGDKYLSAAIFKKAVHSDDPLESFQYQNREYSF